MTLPRRWLSPDELLPPIDRIYPPAEVLYPSQAAPADAGRTLEVWMVETAEGRRIVYPAWPCDEELPEIEPAALWVMSLRADVAPTDEDGVVCYETRDGWKLKVVEVAEDDPRWLAWCKGWQDWAARMSQPEAVA